MKEVSSCHLAPMQVKSRPVTESSTVQKILKRRERSVATLNSPISVVGNINVGHSNCLVQVEITWAQKTLGLP